MKFKYFLENSLNSELKVKLDKLKPSIAQVAQSVYDAWDEENVDEYANGGICHLIADKVAALLDKNGIGSLTHSLDYKQHVVVIAYDETNKESFMVDIPESIYETGGGFQWSKIPDVVFDQHDVEVISIDYDEWITNNSDIYESSDSEELADDEWYHGDPNQRHDFCDQKMDRDRYTADPNANGPGIYFTKDKDQAYGYAEPNGYFYKVRINTDGRKVILEKHKASSNKKFLFKLIKKAQEHDADRVFYAVSDYEYVTEPSEVRDQHIINLINKFLANESLIGACVIIYKEFFNDANLWAKSMSDLGVAGFIQQQPETTHFVAYDCNIIEILETLPYQGDK